MLTKPLSFTDRKDQILIMRDEGLSYTQIGRRFGISYERVRQILNNAVNRQSNKPAFSSPLKTSEVAQMLNLHVNTVRRWSKQGLLKAYRVGPRGDRRFDREEVLRLTFNITPSK